MNMRGEIVQAGIDPNSGPSFAVEVKPLAKKGETLVFPIDSRVADRNRVQPGDTVEFHSQRDGSAKIGEVIRPTADKNTLRPGR